MIILLDFLLALAVGAVCIYLVNRLPDDSACNQDCNQGRNCTCANQ